MEIKISRTSGFSGHKYSIAEGGRQAYAATLKSFSWKPEINLLDSSGKEILNIKRSRSFFKVIYEIRRHKDTLTFKMISTWKRRYQCMVGTALYEIKSKNKQCEIYRNDVLVAGWARKSDGWFKGDTYTITADKENDRELLIAFCLVIDNIMLNDHAAAAAAVG